MIRRFLVRLLFSTTLLFPCALIAQLQQIGGISGQIHIAGGDFPPHQIMVELRLHEATINSVYADAQGHFSFGSLEGNPYHIVVNDDAYYPVDERVDLRPDAPYVNLEIFLRPREEPKKGDPLGARASGSNPDLVNPADYNRRFPRKAIKEYERGLSADRRGEPDEAIAHYVSALKIAPDYYPAHNNLGTLYLGKSDFKAAEAHFRESVRLNRDDAEAYFNLGNVLMLTGRYSDSEDVLSSGLQRRPDSAFGHFLQGCLYERTARFPQAEASLHDAVKLDPAMWQAQLQIANLYIRQRRDGEAINQLRTFLKLFPSVHAAQKAKAILEGLQAKQSTASNQQ